MIVSWNWLSQYVALDMPIEELERRLMMAGLNHEGTEKHNGDVAIDFEITSNRPDCLGHLGIAREVSVLFDRELKIPAAKPAESSQDVTKLTKVRIDCPDLCYRYTARVIRGAKIGPSPKWLRSRLATVGVAAINNVVDITNYVLLECGQPLHVFDLKKLAGPEIVVRRGLAGEKLEAIDHRTYDPGTETCVIADAQRAAAIGGIMGGSASEVGPQTTDLLVECAWFAPQAIRTAARQLHLHSDSSYRFERGIDPAAMDWASRRTCELILELAGGELAKGVIDVGRQPPKREPISLRYAQLPRILGIEIEPARARQILTSLGNRELKADSTAVTIEPASWRNDLTREADLIEEVARIHGYEAIPEDVSVPMATSRRRDKDRILEIVRRALTAAGFDEAMTTSVVSAELSAAFSPWTEAPPLVAQLPLLRGADHLRRSLIPSLLHARRTNESLSNERIELFEIASVYLPRAGTLPDEELMLSLTSGGDFLHVKGVIEAMLAALDPRATLETENAELGLFDRGRSCWLRLGGKRMGLLGELSEKARGQFDLRGPTTVAELRFAPLAAVARLVPQWVAVPDQPAVTRDLNLVVAEGTRWAEIAAAVQSVGEKRLERVEYRDTYRDEQRLGAGKKSFLLNITLRDPGGALTSGEADGIRDRIIERCRTACGAELRA